MNHDTLELRRFLRTVRVATHTALAEYEIEAARRIAAGPVAFHALAARGAGAFRFPDAGLSSGDGLLSARLERSSGGRPLRLVLQAEGAAGLDAWSGRSGRVRFGDFGPDLAFSFDRDGRASVDLTGDDLVEEDLAAFTLETAETR